LSKKTKRETIAYAITHAPRGVKGGPYTGNGSTAHQVPSMALARRYALDDLHEAQADVAWLVRNEYTARVIRIVQTRPSPSEASAVEVLRELVAWDEGPLGRRANADDIFARARRILAASGPDPMPVVRAAMAWRHDDRPSAEDDLVDAVDTYRKAGGK
jgi:hypothetical protein